VADSKYLAIYLNDHLAASVGAVQLSRRAARANGGSAYGDTLARLSDEIVEDRQALRDVMERLGVRADPLKMAASAGAELAGRLKLNGELRRYSPLSRLEEIEILTLGVTGKLGLWQSLGTALGDDARLGGVDFEELGKRAGSQRRRLERLRRRAAGEALRAAGA
jgi:hypothetical protein